MSKDETKREIGQASYAARTHDLEQQLSALRAELLNELNERDRLARDLALRDAALDVSSSHFMIVDVRPPSRPVVYINRACAKAHGYEPAELLGQSVSMLIPIEDIHDGDPTSFAAMMARGDGVRVEAEVLRRDGVAFWAGFVASRILNSEGAVTHLVTVGADITAKREAEFRRAELQEQLVAEMREREQMAVELRLAQKLESVGRLAGSLAHEINTPIQYVSDSVHFLRSAHTDLARLSNAYGDALALAAPDPESQLFADIHALERELHVDFLRVEVPRAFARALEGMERVAGIVRAVKEFAHPEEIEQRAADLNHAIQTTLLFARNEYKHHAEVVSHLDHLPPIICNIGELNQVFLNLIITAAHAIHDAGKDASAGRITLTTRVVDTHVEVGISDNGCGISADNLEKSSTRSSRPRKWDAATGQGLAIARAIVVEKHAGRIDVTSTPGLGTKFILRLPIDGRTERNPAPTASAV